jgi:hypothetical protein
MAKYENVLLCVNDVGAMLGHAAHLSKIAMVFSFIARPDNYLKCAKGKQGRRCDRLVIVFTRGLVVH